ncbi:MAG: hypothetical protein SOV91_02195 [Eubacteriales bacterium]|nr:hypothetical protein [Eubacteriales bacterium]
MKSKPLAMLVCVCCIVTCSSCATVLPTPIHAVAETSSPPICTQDAPLPSPADLYAPILEVYTAYADIFITQDGSSADLVQKLTDASGASEELQLAIGDKAYQWSCMLTELALHASNSLIRSDFLHEIRDIDHNGIQELLLYLTDGTLLATFTQKNGNALLLDAFWSRHRCLLREELFYFCNSNGADAIDYLTMRISASGTTLETVNGIRMDGTQFYRITGNETELIPQTEYQRTAAFYINIFEKQPNV